MTKKILFTSLILSGFVLFGMAEIFFVDAPAELEQAKGLYETGEYQQAEKAYKAIVTDHPGTEYALKAQKNLAVSYILVQKSAEAQSATDRLITDFSGNSDLPAMLSEIATTYRWTMEFEQAKNTYQLITQHCPGSQGASNAQLDITKLDILSLIQSEDNGSAQTKIDSLIANFSEHPYLAEVLYDFACVYEWSGKYEEAKGIYEKIIQQCAGSSYAQKAQIDVQKVEILYWVDRGDDSEAQAAIDTLIGGFSGNSYLPEALYCIAVRYEWTAKKYEKAKNVYQQVIQHGPDSSSVNKARLDIPRLQIQSLIDADNIKGASAATDKLITDFAGDSYLPDVLYHIAIKYEDSGKFGEAKSAYRRVAQQCPDSSFATKARLKIPKVEILSLLDAGNNSEALSVVDKFIAEHPNNTHLTWIVSQIVEWCDKKARNLEDEGLADESQYYFQNAVTVGEKVINELPGDPYMIPQIYSCVGLGYRKLGQYEKSIDYYLKVIDDYPEHYFARSSMLQIGRNYQSLKNSGAMSASEADLKTKAAYELLVDTYPASGVAGIASSWLSQYAGTKGKEDENQM